MNVEIIGKGITKEYYYFFVTVKGNKSKVIFIDNFSKVIVGRKRAKELKREILKDFPKRTIINYNK